MTMTIRILLLLAVTVCITAAQRPVSQRCLCRKVRDKNFGGIKSVEDVQIFPPSQSCTRLEIIVSLKNGVQYCLDPKMKIVQNLLTRLMNKPAPPTVPSPTEVP
uniref:Macrophage inflammatory protein 2 n=1 Tax=Esox lucius TaxID=8010 RepID=C1BWP6_ESOLU|nr:Macrophage inflammatory protein 2 precursor [Esox lucius]